MDRLSDETVAIYDRVAAVYDAGRRKDLFERVWLERALCDAAPGAAVLDLGCGAGAPIAEWLVAQGFAVTGLDAAPGMLALFRARLPGTETVLADMRDLDLGRRFAAIIGWGSFFHLRPEEQRAALPRLAGHLAPGGRLLLTVGPEASERIGSVGGAPVYHASLAPGDYAAILSQADVRVERFAPEAADAAGFSLLLARRAGQAGRDQQSGRDATDGQAGRGNSDRAKARNSGSFH